jgi:hypothetical protein
VSNDSGTIHLTRRRFLGLTAGTVTQAACGSSSPEQELAASKFFADQTIVADGTPQRTIWSLRDEQGDLGDLAPDSIEYQVLDPGQNQIASGIANRHVDGLTQGYYPIVVPFGEPGLHEFRFLTENHGRHVGFAVPGTREESTIYWPGDQFPSVVTPTLGNDAGVAQICTRTEICPFHDVSLDASMASGRSTLLLVSTPAFCGVGFMCGPVLEILIDEIATGGHDLDVIHAEVYRDPQSDNLGPVAPIVEASGVSYEPYMFLLGPDGNVLRRLDHLWDRAELRDVLAEA